MVAVDGLTPHATMARSIEWAITSFPGGLRSISTFKAGSTSPRLAQQESAAKSDKGSNDDDRTDGFHAVLQAAFSIDPMI